MIASLVNRVVSRCAAPVTVVRCSSAAVNERIGKKSLLNRVCEVEDTLKYFEDGQILGWTGFTPVGYPKAVPIALAEYVEANNLQGQMKFTLLSGASLGSECEDRWAANGMIARRFPYQTGSHINKGINGGAVAFQDMHVGEFPQMIEAGFFDTQRTGRPVDVALVEATEILEDGSIVLGGSGGIAPELIRSADKVIIEMNTSIPSYRGMHDIFMQPLTAPRVPIPIRRVDDRAGTVSVPCDPDKIVAIVESTLPDNGRALAETDDESRLIAGHILDFLENEVARGRLPENLTPLQSGVGGIANAIVGALVDGPFEDLTVWTEVLQNSMLDFFDSGKLTYASTCALSLCPKYFEKLYGSFDEYGRKIMIRNQQVSNHAEVIRRLGTIAMNTPVEVDIFGHCNSSLVMGSRVINGLGGSGDFLRNALLSFVHTPSARPSKNGDPTGISCIVPMVSHVDHTEHDVDIYVTEQGIADTRGLSARERRDLIIEKCAHPDFRPQLRRYVEMSEAKCGGMMHEPHDLEHSLEMHTKFMTEGTMKIDW